MKNSTEATNDFLEFLAGRREQPPSLPANDEDVLEAANVLRRLRKEKPNPEFQQQLRGKIVPVERPAHKTEGKKLRAGRQFSQPMIFRFAIPVFAVALVAAVAFIVPQSFWTKLMKRDTYSKYVAKEAQAAVITLEASKEDSLGVDAATRFTLAAKEGTLTLDEVKQNFKLTPFVDFDVQEKANNTFEISPKVALAANTVYAATFKGDAESESGTTEERTYSWAYQVRNAFQVIGTLPRNKATGVVPETGIEVTFSSSGVSAKELEKNLAIVPKTDGRIEVHNRTLVFVPSKKLKEKAMYTVTVKKGLKPENAAEGLADDVVFQFEVSGPQQDKGTAYSKIVSSTIFESIRPDEPLVFADYSYPFVYGGTAKSEDGSSTGAQRTYDFTVYKYQDLEAFVSSLEQYQKDTIPWAMYANEDTTYATDGLTKVGTFKTKSENNVVTLGNAFDEGFYLADSTSNNSHSQIPFLVSTIGAYSIATKTDTLVWINDLQAGKAVNGAEVEVRGTGTKAASNTDGIATFTTPDGLRQNQSGIVFATVKADGKESLMLINGNRSYGYGGYRMEFGDALRLAYASDKYWSYLSTDRDLYLPNDTVRFWGVLKRRDGPKSSEKVKLTLVQSNYEGRYSVDVLKTVEVTATPTGTYTGSIDLKDVPTSGYPQIVVSVGDDWVTSKSFSVETYKKPPYQITVTPDKYAAIAGDTIQYSITTTFFDGTPVSNVGLRLEQHYGAEHPDVVTDANGNASYSRKAEREDWSSSSVSFVPFEQYEGEIRGSSSVTVYPARFQIDATASVDAPKATVTGTARNLKPELADPASDDPLGKVIDGPRANQKIDGKLIAVITDKIPDGTYYDFLAKKVVERFRYTTHEEERESFTLTTDAKGTFTKTFTIDPSIFYRVTLSGTDEVGNAATAETYLWRHDYGYWWSMGASEGANLSLVDLNQVVNQQAPSYAIGDEVKLQVVRGDGPVSSDLAKKILYITSQRGLKSYALKEEPTYSFTFNEESVPMLYTRAVVFTGIGFAEVSGPTIDFKESTKALTISVTPDRASYGPGDTVNLVVKVVDKGGSGQNARLNLSAVDEAIVSLQGERHLDPLSSIYTWVDEGVISSYVSHKEASLTLEDIGAERGGGGGERIDFRDNALFTEIETDASGNGLASFKLPDNLTSWRITAQAVTDDLKAGVKDKLIPVQKPLFVVTTFSDQSLSSDQQKLRATAFGTGVKAGDSADFTFSIVDMPGSETTKEGKAFEAVSFDMPKLEVGDYQVRVAVSAQGQQDAVVEPLHVVSSNLLQRTVKTALLEKNEAPVFAQTGRTELRIGDADRNLAYEFLWGLLWNPYTRLDDTVAGRIATKILEDEFGEHAWMSPGDPTSFLTDKGVSLYAIGSEDLEYGALAAADAAFSENRGKLVSWFQRTVDDPTSNTEQVAYSLYGLAQLREPVLPEIRSLLGVEGLSDHERLTLGLALEALGAKEEARPIASYLLATYGETQEPYIRLKFGATDDERIVNTARLAILAASLDLNEQYGLLRFVHANTPKDTATHLEQALAVKRLLENAPTGTVSISYSLNGKTETRRLSKTEALTLSVTPDEAKSFSIAEHSGNVSVVSTYGEPFDPAAAKRDPNLTINRKYSVNGRETTTFKKGDLVKIELSWSKKSGAFGKSFGIVDLLPTGLRVVSNPWLFGRSNSLYYPYAVENNRVKFYAWDKPFYYYARAVVAGTATAEPATIQAFDAPTNVQYSSAANVVIE